jgi:hemerythrin-like domain-containing protein
MQRRVGWLAGLYHQHIRMEDTEVFPLAARVLSAEQIAQIGSEMAQRRQLNPGRAQSRCGQRRRALQL